VGQFTGDALSEEVKTTHQLGEGTGGPHCGRLGRNGFKQGENLELLGIAKALWLAHHQLPFWGIG
jgi:hypothetical protein